MKIAIFSTKSFEKAYFSAPAASLAHELSFHAEALSETSAHLA